MISHGEGYVVRHSSGRYLQGWIGGSYWLIDDAFNAGWTRNAGFCGRFLGHPEWSAVADQYEVVPVPGCGCCGGDHRRSGYPLRHAGAIYRCAKHVGRDACAIEGCRRSSAATSGFGADDRWLCATHWRIACPPRSALRRTYHRFFRLGRRYGWTPELDLRLDRFWRALLKRARAGRQPDVDMAAVNALFGWSEAA